MASEHGPLTLDDLLRAHAVGLDIGQDLSDRVGRRTIGRDHLLKRLGVVHDPTEGLSELMCNRAGQRRHRGPATDVSRECQVPPAVDLGSLPRATLEQQPDNQQRLDGQYAGRAPEPWPCIRATGSDLDSSRRCRAATDSRGCPTAAARAQSNIGWPGTCGGTLMLLGEAPFKIRIATSAVRRPRSSMDSSAAADDAGAEVHAMHRKYGSIRRSVKIGDDSLVRIRGSRRVSAERDVENRRVGWKARAAAQDLREGTDRRTRQRSRDREIA